MPSPEGVRGETKNQLIMDQVALVIGVIIVAVVIFLICRELNCWYLKINARKDLLEEMVKNQKEIIRLLGGNKVEPAAKVAEAPAEKPKEVTFSVGQKVKTKVEKNNLPVGSIVRIDRIEGTTCVCSQEMAEVGKFSFSEVEAV